MQNSIECIEIPELIGGATFTNGGLLIYGKSTILSIFNPTNFKYKKYT